MDEYGLGLKAVINILDPEPFKAARPVQAAKRREREVKRFKNPHTGEVVETKGGNHKVLNAWKAEYGADAVKTWLQ
ncbi:hypothetical protein D9M70_564450 [compost metagenome]